MRENNLGLTVTVELLRAVLRSCSAARLRLLMEPLRQSMDSRMGSSVDAAERATWISINELLTKIDGLLLERARLEKTAAPT